MADIVFITGGSGHIGSRVIIDTLQAGYQVRAAVRNQNKVDKILSAPSIKALSPGNRLDFAIVPDLLVDGAYNKAIKGATFVIHIASPIYEAHKEGESYQTTFIEPAVKGTLNILEAAKKTSSIKRIVITSSVVGIFPWKDFISGAAVNIYNEKSRTPFVPEPYHSAFEAYSASKVAALNETEAWLEREKALLSFDVVHIFPGFVIGAHELITEASDAIRGTNKVVLGPITGLDLSYTPGTSVHLRDVSLAHVKSLDPKIPGNQGYLLTSGGLEGTHLEDSFNIVSEEFLDAVKAGALPNNGKIITVPVRIDESASEKILGFKFRSFEDQVIDMVKHYLELVATVSD
jgi:succinate dehydrogenase (ubiquinone) flavoprotein subunit